MKPLVLIILDGWGVRVDEKDNGIALSRKPNFDNYWKNYPHAVIDGSGRAVGLPEGVMGNSEVGHMNMGAGRIVYSGLSQIYHSIEDGSFYSNPAFMKALAFVGKKQSALHLMGLVSDGAVHSHQDHLYALLDLAKREGISDIFIHCFMDGRDTPPQSGRSYIEKLKEQMVQKKIGTIATVCGRYFAMDRDKRWDRIEKAYNALTGFDTPGCDSAEEIIGESYRNRVGDEFIVPRVVTNGNEKAVGSIKDGDAVIFFNFRPDRARQITEALTQPDFTGFKRQKIPFLSSFVCMTPYDPRFSLPTAYTPSTPKRIFAEVISEKGLTQLRIAETEKYAHVTYFFNGGREVVFKGEERVLVPSARDVATYDLKPAMSAVEISEEAVKRLYQDKYDVIIMNFANADMVGHTAKPAAVRKAIEVIDGCLGKIVSLVLKKDGVVVITADHGNAEQMVDESGNPHTAHTTNLVPFILVSGAHQYCVLKKEGGRLCDVAPTLLNLLHLEKPPEMTGESLLVDKKI